MKATELDKLIDERQSKWKPNHGSGKTKYNRLKNRGESWTELRDNAKENK